MCLCVGAYVHACMRTVPLAPISPSRVTCPCHCVEPVPCPAHGAAAPARRCVSPRQLPRTPITLPPSPPPLPRPTPCHPAPSRPAARSAGRPGLRQHLWGLLRARPLHGHPRPEAGPKHGWAGVWAGRRAALWGHAWSARGRPCGPRSCCVPARGARPCLVSRAWTWRPLMLPGGPRLFNTPPLRSARTCPAPFALFATTPTLPRRLRLPLRTATHPQPRRPKPAGAWNLALHAAQTPNPQNPSQQAPTTAP